MASNGVSRFALRIMCLGMALFGCAMRDGVQPSPEAVARECGIRFYKHQSHGIWEPCPTEECPPLPSDVLYANSAIVPPGVLAGRVLGPDQKGVAGAVLRLYWLRSRTSPHSDGIFGDGAWLQHAWDPKQHEVATGTSDELGHFEIQLPYGVWERKPECFLVATKEKLGARHIMPYFRASRFSDPREEFPNRPRTIHMYPEDRIEGVVIDESGEPVAGARVAVASRGVQHAHTLTDESGAFTLRGFDRNQTTHLCVGRTPSDLGMLALFPANGEAARIRLPRGRTCSLRMVDVCGRPLANHHVMVDGAGLPLRWTGICTDGEGVLNIDGVAADGVRINKVGPKPITESGATIEFTECCRIPLEVVDDDTGAAVSNVLVYDAEHPCDGALLTEDQWRSGDPVTFILGVHSVGVAAKGYVPWSGEVQIRRTTEKVTVRLKRQS